MHLPHTTGRLLLEVGGIPDRELEKLKQEAEHLEKQPFPITFYMDKPKEEWERGPGTTNEFFTDKRRYISSDASDKRNFINITIAGTLQAGTAHILLRVDGEVATTIDKGYQNDSPCDETNLQRGEHEGTRLHGTRTRAT